MTPEYLSRILSQTPRFFQTPRILSGILLKFWNFEALYVCASPLKKMIFFLQLLKNGCLSAATCPANQCVWSWSLWWFILNQAQSFGSDKSLSLSTKDALSSCSTRAALNMERTVTGWGIRGLDILDRGIKSCGSPPTNNFPFVLVPIHKGR